MTELEVLEIVVKRLKEVKISYMVSGSVALNFYAEPRMTRDIDIVINLQTRKVDKFFEKFKDDFYIDKDMILESLRDNSMFNIIHNESILKIDFIIRKNEQFRILEFENRKKRMIQGVEIDVVSIEDLIISKLFWAKDSFSETQLKDIKKLMNSDFNLSYVKEWCKKLNLLEIFNKANE